MPLPLEAHFPVIFNSPLDDIIPLLWISSCKEQDTQYISNLLHEQISPPFIHTCQKTKITHYLKKRNTRQCPFEDKFFYRILNNCYCLRAHNRGYCEEFLMSYRGGHKSAHEIGTSSRKVPCGSWNDLGKRPKSSFVVHVININFFDEEGFSSWPVVLTARPLGTAGKVGKNSRNGPLTRRHPKQAEWKASSSSQGFRTLAKHSRILHSLWAWIGTAWCVGGGLSTGNGGFWQFWWKACCIAFSRICPQSSVLLPWRCHLS